MVGPYNTDYYQRKRARYEATKRRRANVRTLIWIAFVVAVTVLGIAEMYRYWGIAYAMAVSAHLIYGIDD